MPLIAPLATKPLGALESALPPEVAEALDEAEMLLAEGDYTRAVRAFKQAEKLCPEPSIRCMLGLATCFNRMEAYKNAGQYAHKALQIAETPADRAGAFNQLGMSVFAGGRCDDEEELHEAEEAFRQVLALSQGRAIYARYNLAEVLLKQGHDTEGLELLRDFLALEPEGPFAERARSLIRNPERARVRLVPDLDLVTLDGEYITSDDLRGKVILIDFWGTWCPACVHSVPQLRSLSRAKGPFVLLSVSTDSDEELLRRFIDKHRMAWPQVWDKDHQIRRLFDVSSFPSYYLVDHNGVMIGRWSGWSEAIARDLSARVHKAIRAAKKAQREATG